MLLIVKGPVRRAQDVFYRGAVASPSELRQFPGLDELRRSSALEEIFSSGQAAIFRTRLDCLAS